MTEKFAELFEETQVESKMRLGAIVSATVVDIERDIVVVNAGLKSEGLIPVSQFFNEKGEIEVKVGDEVDVSLDAVEDGFGETKLSREKAKRFIAWQYLEQAFTSGEIVSGMIADRVKGGFTVDIGAVRAFLPGSLVDVRPIRDISALEGKMLDFKVVKIDQQRNNVVVSRRAVLVTEDVIDRAKLLESLEEGAIVSGIVKNTTGYGAFIDLGGADGLLHITDMAWRRVKSPSEIVSIGDEIMVKVLKFDRESERVSLGLKQMGEDPWVHVGERYVVGTTMTGKVSNLTDYGGFVELEEGVEGLVHISEIDWIKKSMHPSKLLQIGETVEISILEVDTTKRRISLSIKRCKANPWEQFAATYAKGDKVSGIIKSITDFGIFVGFENDIDGLVHISDITWSGEGSECIRQYNKGDKLEAVILSITPENSRIALGLKQIQEDPFALYTNAHPKGSLVTATVKSIETQGVKMVLAEGVTGYMKASEISADKQTDAPISNNLKVGDSIEVKITAVDRKKRSINVSIRAKETDEEAIAMKKYRSETADQANIKLGQLFKKD